MDKDTHVYCTDCRFGEELIQKIIHSEGVFEDPKECVGCYPFNPEDSVPYTKRPKYKPLQEGTK